MTSEGFAIRLGPVVPAEAGTQCFALHGESPGSGSRPLRGLGRNDGEGFNE
jgi:hypothetical protein